MLYVSKTCHYVDYNNKDYKTTICGSDNDEPDQYK